MGLDFSVKVLFIAWREMLYSGLPPMGSLGDHVARGCRTRARRAGIGQWGMHMLSSRRIALAALVIALTAPPVFAQIDLAGMWRPMPRNEDGSGMDGDYAGLPLNAAGRWRAQSWVPENFDVPEWVCRPHSWDFSVEAGASRLRGSPRSTSPPRRSSPIAAGSRCATRKRRSGWTAAPRPPDWVRHSWSGFSTGEWQGDTLVQTATHLKENYIRRWGAMRSDQATVRIRYKRIGDYLRTTVIIYDPVYFDTPYIRTNLFWMNDPDLQMPPYPCDEATETVVARGTVPHQLPGKAILPAQNPDLTDRFGSPYEARLGGAETMYPEYIAKMKTFRRPPTVFSETGERGQ